MFPVNQPFQQKTDYCFYCYTPITIPASQSLTKCPSPICRKLNVFLCHIVNLESNFNDIVCLKCSSNFVVLTCEQCGGFQAWSKTHENFRNGQKHECPCGAVTTLVYCNNCQAILSIKGKKSHQLAPIQCKRCQHEFRYKLCPACQTLNYKDKWDTSEVFPCVNGSCPMSQIKNPYDLGENQHFKDRLSQFQQQKAKQVAGTIGQQNKTEDKQLCKVCFNAQANTINTKCYHLAVCEKCAQSLKRQCPICRSQGGEFKKVFKA